jgi:hypothetical protein
MFADVKIRNSPIRLSKGLSLAETSIELPGDDRTILCLGANSLRRCRVKSREAVRIAGGGTFSIDGCWLEAIGIGNDHADCIQCYSPGDTGTLHIKNTTIRAYRTSDVTPPQIGSQGLFVADNWTGAVICENVVFWRGRKLCLSHISRHRRRHSYRFSERLLRRAFSVRALQYSRF